MNRFFTTPSAHRIGLMILFFFFSAGMLSGCSGCSGKKKSSSSAAVIPPPAPEPETPPEPAPAPAPAPGNKDVGDEVPAITVDSASNIDTSAGASLKHLIFETSSNQEAGRYLSEFLIAVYSRETSCVRLKVRPTDGISAEVDESVLQNGEGTGACAGQKVAGEEKEEEQPEPTVETPPVTTPATALRMADLEFIRPENDASRGFNLAGQTAALCSSRIFRMESPASQEKPLAKVFTKTGRLLQIGSKVRIWLDEEYANVCSGGSGLDAKSAFGYGILASNGIFLGRVSKLWMAHLTNLASEMDKIVTGMTGQYGPISDIDQSGFVEIFVSPDVNRFNFIKYETRYADRFRAIHEFKPQDLAYYNSESNPTSNEGEILYMWAPDQGGIYNGVQFPSADSVSSNYAKGFLSAQAMNLIIANQKLFIQKQRAMEDFWLADSLASLASMYYAGNDYLFGSLANFLTSRPQYISITDGADTKLISNKYQSTGGEETRGMRAAFGWYLHSRLCGATAVTPCDKIKNLIDSKQYGVKNVEAVLGESFDKIMINFTLSVGIGLLPDPAKILTLWVKDAAILPAIPLLLPNLTEIYNTAPPVTEESDINDSQATLLASSKIDKTQAGPFPSRDSLLFQPITSDNDMEFKTAKNSITFVLVTSLVESKSDVTAFLGKGLNVTFIPVGDRDVSKRRIHIEKVSELAHRDLRPTNLTDEVDPNGTNRYESEYDGIDFSVTKEREIWIMGSIDNYKENVLGSLTTIGDTDAYTIDIQPCAGALPADLAACTAANHSTLVQIHIRDFDKELAPMLITTVPDLKIYRGSSVLGRVTEIEPLHITQDGQVDYLCQSKSDFSIVDSDICNNGQLVVPSGEPQPTFSHDLTVIDPTAYAHRYQNFLMTAPAGFPYSNINSVTYKDQPDCEGFSCYLEIENIRQHYKFKFTENLKPLTHNYYTTSPNLSFPVKYSIIDYRMIPTLAMLKGMNFPNQCVGPVTDTFAAECQTIPSLTEVDCRNICGNGVSMTAKIQAWVAREGKVLVCGPGATCSDELFLISAPAWVPVNRFFWYDYSTSAAYTSYYRPNEPTAKSGYCAGIPGGTTALTCGINSSVLPTATDIREQFDVAIGDFKKNGCGYQTIGTDFKVCVDNISWDREINETDEYAYYAARTKLTTDRVRQYYTPISTRSGEVLAKPERVQLIQFDTPGTGSKVNLIVGGRKESQGKYLIRVRLKDFERPYGPN